MQDGPMAPSGVTKRSDGDTRVSTRQRIIEEAIALFNSQGIAGTRIFDIESAVGLAVGTGSFHRHFRNKEDLLDAVIAEVLTDFAVPDLAVGPDEQDLAQRIETGVRELQDHMVTINLLVRLRSERPDLAERFYEGFQEWVGQAAPDPDPRTTIITSAIVGFVISSQFFGRQPGRLEPAEFARTFAEMIGPQGRDTAAEPSDDVVG